MDLRSITGSPCPSHGICDLNILFVWITAQQIGAKSHPQLMAQSEETAVCLQGRGLHPR